MFGHVGFVPLTFKSPDVWGRVVLSKELHHCIKLHMAESHLSESDYMLRFSLEDRIHWLGDSGCQSTSVGRARSCYCRGDILQWVDQRTVVCLLPGLHQAVSFQIQCKAWALRKVGGLERPPTPELLQNIQKNFAYAQLEGSGGLGWMQVVFA